MNTAIYNWAHRWNIPHAALQELSAQFGITADVKFSGELKERSEAAVQVVIRLEAARKGLKLWRNNVGVLLDATGRPVRYGLANDSPALNKAIKSGDLVGWRPVIVTPAHVGSKIAQFVSRECKRPGWSYTSTEHEQAQFRWIETLVADGGDACFATGEGTL